MNLILHYLKGLANPSGPLWTLKAVTCLTGILFLLFVRLTVLQSIEAQQIKCDYSQLIIGSQNIFTFYSLLFPTKKCSHVLQLVDAEMKCDSSQWTCPIAFEILEILLKNTAAILCNQLGRRWNVTQLTGPFNNSSHHIWSAVVRLRNWNVVKLKIEAVKLQDTTHLLILLHFCTKRSKNC